MLREAWLALATKMDTRLKPSRNALNAQHSHADLQAIQPFRPSRVSCRVSLQINLGPFQPHVAFAISDCNRRDEAIKPLRLRGCHPFASCGVFVRFGC